MRRQIVRIAVTMSIATAPFAGCSSSSTEPSPAVDLNARRLSLLMADQAHANATSRSLLDGMPAVWADDILLLWPSLPLASGRAQALATVQGLSNASARTMSWYPVRADVSADGRDGYTYGYGSRTAPSASGPVTTTLQYMAYWRATKDGQWRVHAWTFGAAAPPLPLAAPVGCETPTNRDSPKSPGSTAPRAATEVRAADSTFAAQAARDGAESAFRMWGAADAAAVGMGSLIVCGRSAAAALFAGPPGALTWAPSHAVASTSGDLGFTVGVARVAGTPVSYTKYLTIWKRQADGAWRFVADGGNATPAPQ